LPRGAMRSTAAAAAAAAPDCAVCDGQEGNGEPCEHEDGWVERDAHNLPPTQLCIGGEETGINQHNEQNQTGEVGEDTQSTGHNSVEDVFMW